mgnify:CR=1 FL=1
MKAFLLLCLLVTSVDQLAAQDWQQFSDKATGITFALPENAQTFEQEQLRVYASAIDSTLAVQVHVFDNASAINPRDEIIRQVLEEEKGDTLRTIARVMLLATNSKATELIAVRNNRQEGLQVGFSYSSLASDVPFHSFVQYFLLNGRFVAFTVTGAEREMRRLLQTKEYFFSTIKLSGK